MSLYSPQRVVTKDLILNSIPQEDIMEYYLGIPVKYNGKFCSPLRPDNTPTCNFCWSDGKLWYRDWAESMPRDCFDVVGELYGENFHEVLNRIAKDFDIIDEENNIDPQQIRLYRESVKKEQSKYVNSQKSIIKVSLQKFTNTDIRYLTSYKLNSSIVNEFNVFSPRTIWLNGNLIYHYNKKDPALAYYFGKDENENQKWKIYFYRRDDYRFLSNTSRINGWIQLPESGDHLVITKSLKDVMCLYKFNVPAIAMQGESQIPYDYIIEELENRFFHIITLMDWDSAGQRAAWKIRDLYDISATFLTDGRFGTKEFKQKDFSDYLKDNDYHEAQQLVNCILSHAENN